MWWDAMRSPAARWNHPKAVEKTVPWKPWKTKPRFPTAPTAPWKTRNLGEFPTFPPPCDSLFPSLKKTKGQEGSMKQADRSSVNKSGQIQKLPTLVRPLYLPLARDRHAADPFTDLLTFFPYEPLHAAVDAHCVALPSAPGRPSSA